MHRFCVAKAWSFFKLLDLDQRGDVEIEAFLMGCLRLSLMIKRKNAQDVVRRDDDILMYPPAAKDSMDASDR